MHRSYSLNLVEYNHISSSSMMALIEEINDRLKLTTTGPSHIQWQLEALCLAL